MVSFNKINNYAKKIKQKFHPEKVILFGSYATGKPTEDSDIDLLVIMKTRLRPVEQAVFIRKELPSPFPVDLLVRKPEEIEKRIKDGDFFLKAVLKKGKKL